MTNVDRCDPEPGVAIVGASVAGVAAAEAVRGARYPGPVWLIDEQSHEPYDRPPLSKHALSTAALAAGAVPATYRLRDTRHWQELNVDLLLGSAVTKLDGPSHRLWLADGCEFRCRAIVLAPGARPRPLPFPVDETPIHVLRGLDDAHALARTLRRARRLLVIGAGFIGLEVASAARDHGVAVTVVEISDAPLAPAIGEPAADYLLQRHRESGSVLLCGRSVQAVRRDGAGVLAVLADGQLLRADAVVAGLGVRPATDWLVGSGVELGDGIVADERLRATAEGIYACGDAACWLNPVYDRRMRIEHWTTAREQGDRAGANAALFALTGQAGAPFAHVPYVWSDQLGMKLQFVGRRLPGATIVVERSDESGHVSTHWLDGQLVGCMAINSPRDAMLARRTIQTQWEQVRSSASTAAFPPRPAHCHLNPHKGTERHDPMAKPTAPTVLFDPTDGSFLADPYPALEAIRESGTPVAYAPTIGKWIVTRHEDVYACQRDARLGRAFDHLYTPEQIGAQPRDPRYANFWEAERFSLLELEPPSHDRIRSLVSSAFTPRRVIELRQPARRRATDLLSTLREHDSFDLLHDYAMPYSVSIICDLLGADPGYERLFLDWAHSMVRMYEADTTEQHAVEADEAARSFIACVRELIAKKRKNPANDLISALVSVHQNGDTLSEQEIVSTVIILLNAGHEATVNTTGNGIVALLTHPDQWRQFLAHGAEARQTVEELIRWDPPLQLFQRWVLTDDMTIGGVEVPFGARVAMLYGAANRDPRVFEDPERLDIGRVNASRHVSFGGGVHACVGAPLARIELEASFTVIRDLCPRLQLVAEPKHTNAFVNWGYAAVQVRAHGDT